MPVVFTTSLSFGNIQPASAGFLLQELPVLISGNLYKLILRFLYAIFASNAGIKKPTTR